MKISDERKFHSVPTESHAQEFLASERTFLAWIRTSVAVLSFGFAIVKFEDWTNSVRSGNGSSLGHIAGSLGTLMVVFGGALSAVGAFHYRRTNKQILDGKVQASNWLVLAISAGVVILSIAVIIYLALRGEF